MNRTRLFLLALILLFAAAVRVRSLSDLGFWTDELCTLSCANGHGLQLLDVPTDRIAPPLPVRTRLADAAPLSSVVPALARDETHPPIYVLAVRAWMQLFGESEAAVRSLGVACSVAAIALLYVAAVDDVGTPAALWGCLVMAVATPQVQFAQEARDYAPALALTLAAAVALRALGRRPTVRRGVALAVLALVAVLTHYYAATVMAALAVRAVLTLRGRPRRFALVPFAAAGVAFTVLWGPFMFRQRANLGSNTEWLIDAAPGHVGRVLLDAVQLPARWIADPIGTSAAVTFGTATALWLQIAFIRRPSLRPWVLWITVPVAVVLGLDLARSTHGIRLLRYTLFATPAFYVVLAAAIPHRRFRWVLPAIATTTALLLLPHAYVPAWKIDLRSPVETVGRRLGPEDGLVISGPDKVFDAVTFAAFQHYLPGRMPDAAAILTRPADAATLARLQRCPHVWVVWMWPDRPIASFLPGYRTAETGHLPSFGDIATGTLTAAPSTR